MKVYAVFDHTGKFQSAWKSRHRAGAHCANYINPTIKEMELSELDKAVENVA